MSTWKLLVLTFLLEFFSETESRHAKGRGQKINPALCSPQDAPLGCRRVPRSRDTLSREVFRNTMSGKLLEAMWRIDATGYSSQNIFLTYRYQYSITDIGNEEFTYGSKFRISPVEGANCSVITKEMFPRGRFSSQDKAIMDNGPPVPEPQGVSEWRYWMMSNHPEDYGLLFGCRGKSNIRDGICYGRWFLEVNFPVDKLDNPPMQCILDEMWNKLGLKFSNSLNTFLSIGYPCDDNL